MEPTKDMENIINALLEQDIKAQDELRSHQLLRQQMADDMMKVREESLTQNTKRAEVHVEEQRAHYKAELDEIVAALSKRSDSVEAKLESSYNENFDSWVDTLFNRCVNPADS